MRSRTMWLQTIFSACFAALIAVPAFAEESITTTCSSYAGLTHRLAGCLRETIDNTAYFFFDSFGDLVSNATFAFLTLGVIVYGIMLGFGMVEKVGRDTFMLVIKLAAIIGFITNSPLIYKTVQDVMDEASLAVVTYTPPSDATLDEAGTTTAQTACMQRMVEEKDAKIIEGGGELRAVVAPWLAMDCLLDTVIGIKKPAKDGDAPPIFDGTWFNPKLDNTDPDQSNTGMARGLIYFFFSSIQTSIVGVVLAVIGMVYIFGLLSLIVRVFFVYIMGYMGIAFLVIISPLIIPLVLFQQTKQYFDKWVKLLISFALQPVLMMVFLIFSITAIDLVTFAGSYSIMYRIAGEASREDNFDLNAYLTAPRDVSTGMIDESEPPADTSRPIIARTTKELAQIKADNPTPPPQETKDIGGVANDLVFSRCTKSQIEADKSGSLKTICSTYYPIKKKVDEVDWVLMAKAREPSVLMPDGSLPETPEDLRQQMVNEVLASCFFCAVVIYIMGNLLQIVPMIAHGLAGDVGQTPSLLGGGAGQLGVGGAIGKFSKNFSAQINKGMTAR